MSNQLTVADIAVRQDSEGRYSLNDLHKAAGGAEKHKPIKYLRLDQAKDLTAELEKGQVCPISTHRGRYGGTFVVKELVYAYAMWISPAFHLKVIRAYDQLQTEGVAVADHAADDFLDNPLDYMEKLLGQAKKLKAERDQAQERVGTYQKVVGQLRDGGRQPSSKGASITDPPVQVSEGVPPFTRPILPPPSPNPSGWRTSANRIEPTSGGVAP
ncbi:KilA-N domain-containing protein [Billgrantia azerbaijanica]|nr:KilA-N domain-containing protein [Halomonas azerbaijanica]